MQVRTLHGACTIVCTLAVCPQSHIDRLVKAGMGIQSSAFIMLGAAAVYGVLNLFLGVHPPTRGSGVVSVLCLALVSTVLAMWAFFTGMARTGPSTAAMVSTLESVVTVFSSVLLLSEKLMVHVLIGGCLVTLILQNLLFDKQRVLWYHYILSKQYNREWG